MAAAAVSNEKRKKAAKERASKASRSSTQSHHSHHAHERPDGVPDESHPEMRQRKSVDSVEKGSKKEKEMAYQRTMTSIVVEGEDKGWRKWQRPARRLYNHIYVQVGVAGLIALNFFVNIIQAQIDPKGTKYVDEFGVFEWFFNIAFLIELTLNMYSTWCCRFWKSSWNIFDFFVVLIGWMFQLQVPLPGPMKLLRMMRAFRVFRLFKRVESLRKIMSSLAKAIPGVMNAFLIQLIFICIFAIIAVDRFRDYGEGGFYFNEYDEKVEFQTSRGQDYGFEYYGDFGKALYTMFQCLTGESWSEAVTRPLFNSNSATTSMGSCFFFVFFSLLQGVVLINVVVAVLLEKMVDEVPSPEEDSEDDDDLFDKCADAKADVAKLKEQMSSLMTVSEGMQKQMADVDMIKDQVAALLAHHGIKAPPPRISTQTNGSTQVAETNGSTQVASSQPMPQADAKSLLGAGAEPGHLCGEASRMISPQSLPPSLPGAVNDADDTDADDTTPTSPVTVKAPDQLLE